MPKKFQLIMISAMYENGGNTLQRHLDGHPQLYVYPFESQLGTSLVSDYLTSLFPQKYRWPEFGIEGQVANDYDRVIDEEFKVRLNTPEVSKFRDVSDLGCTNAQRKAQFIKFAKNKSRTRALLIEAFYRATFLEWKTYHHTGKEIAYVGYSPIVGIDAPKIIHDFPTAIILHIVRNPYASYAETKRRPVPYSLTRYIQTWNIVQQMAINYSRQYPKNFFLVRYEDMVGDKKQFFKKIAKIAHISYSPTMLYPSCNGERLPHQYPWGIIDIPTKQAHEHTTHELTPGEHKAIQRETQLINKALGYDAL